ncbi:MAG: hypothetical protein ACYCYM_03500 [Saccharofermentanales bacterium]
MDSIKASDGGKNKSGFNLNPAAAFSLDNPSGVPNFTEEEKQEQKIAGSRMEADLYAAAADPDIRGFVIPEGNYGFNPDKFHSGTVSGFVLKDIERPDENPFTIIATNVTFWFELINKPCPSFARGVHLMNCSNVAIHGLTIDAYSANTIEGKLVKIDIPGNRIEIELLEGTLSDETIIAEYTGSEKRIVPIKADGKAIPALYNINNTWGVEYMFIDRTEKSGAGRYWLYFRSDLLLKTIFGKEWIDRYGSEGTLEEGDGICLLFGSVLGISLDNCRQITVSDFRCYISKGGFWENGGYGNHKWLDCSFSPRPGTNRILGGEGNMSQGIRHGSTYDNLFVGFTSDDAMNIHGFWSRARSIDGDSVLFDYAPVGIEAGDPVEFYDESGNLAESNEVVETPPSRYNYNGFLLDPIRLAHEPSQKVTELMARWPNSECDGWKISNSYFRGVYQRILIQSGTGIFENNTIRDMGSNLAIDTATANYEGGFLKDIIVRNNVFINTAVHPGGNPILVSLAPNWSTNRKARNITTANNVFLGAGSSAISLANTDSVGISGNYFLDLYKGFGLLAPSIEFPAAVVSASQSDNLKISDNKIFIKAAQAEGNGVVNQEAELSSNSLTTDAAEIIDQVWQNVKNKESVSVNDFVTGVF